MRKESGLGNWLRVRWLEAVLLAGLAALLIWYVNIGLGFVPKPTPTPTVTPTRTPVPTRAVRTWTPATTRVVALPTAKPSQTPTPAPRATPIPAGERVFDGTAAYEHVLPQTRLGARPAGSAASRQAQDSISTG